MFLHPYVTWVDPSNSKQYVHGLLVWCWNTRWSVKLKVQRETRREKTWGKWNQHAEYGHERFGLNIMYCLFAKRPASKKEWVFSILKWSAVRFFLQSYNDNHKSLWVSKWAKQAFEMRSYQEGRNHYSRIICHFFFLDLNQDLTTSRKIESVARRVLEIIDEQCNQPIWPEVCIW